MQQDLRFAFRQLLKNPAFSIVAVLTLALAIGANCAIFSAIDAVLLHPLPYPDPDRLVFVGEDLKHFDLHKIPASRPEVNDYRKMVTSFSAIGAADHDTSFTLTGKGDPEMLPGMRITASVFSMLGVRPIIGGLFTSDAEQAGKNRVVVISEGLWKRRFGGDSSIIGRSIQINRESYTVAGVIQPILQFRFAGDVRMPLAFTSGDFAASSRGNQYLDVIGRLKPGVTIAQANAEFQTITRRMMSQYPDFYKPEFGYSLEVYPLAEKAAGDLKTPLVVLIGAVAMVMLIACVNVAGDTIVTWATGLDPTAFDPPTGEPAPDEASPALVPISINLKSSTTGAQMTVPAAYAGLAPNFIGLDQINVQLPANAPTGSVILQMENLSNLLGNAVVIGIQ